MTISPKQGIRRNIKSVVQVPNNEVLLPQISDLICDIFLQSVFVFYTFVDVFFL